MSPLRSALPSVRIAADATIQSSRFDKTNRVCHDALRYRVYPSGMT